MKKIYLLLAGVLGLVMASSCNNNKYEYPFQNPKLSVEKRIDNLISLLTVDEKIGMMMNRSQAVERLGIPDYNWWGEACHGLMGCSDITVFPQSIALAATFDDASQLTTFTMVSDEARARYNNPEWKDMEIGPYVSRRPNLSFWAPNINIFRDPRWGRGQETYGEDPYLMGNMGLNVVLGMQGNDDKYFKTHACAKHYGVHSGPEPLRHKFNAVVSMRDMWETYMPAFEKLVVEGNVQEVMCAYSAYEGVPCCGSDRLLVDILRNRWNYQGLVVSDCDAINDFYTPGNHGYSEGPAEADAAAVLAGTDLECGKSYQKLGESLEKGLITEADLDVSLRRILRGRFTLGMFDPDEMIPWSKIDMSVVDCQAHRDHALLTARESQVLLKNNGVLPLSKDLKKIAVVGPNIDDKEVMRGNYSGEATHYVTILDGIKAKMPNAELVVERGSERENEYLIFPKMANVKSGDKTGFKVDYYGNTKFSGAPIKSEVLETINLRTEGGYGFGEGIPANDFSARFKGQLTPDFTGTLCVAVRGNEYTVTVNGKKIGGSDTAPQGMMSFRTANVMPVEVVEGKTYDIQVDYKAQGEGRMNFINVDVYQRKLAEFDDLKAKVADCDAIIYVGGISPTEEGEGHERSRIELPAVQARFLKAMRETGKPVVYVNCSGSCIAFGEVETYYDALLQAWYSGQEGGTAVADVLFGDYSPSGKLPVTFYASTDQLPDFLDYDMTERTYRYFTGEPLYAFGYGLSYVDFQFGDAKLSKNSIKAGESVSINVPLTNAGKMDAGEVVQVYVKSLSNPDAPIKALKAYKRVDVKAGQTINVKLELEPNSFAYYSEDVDGLKVFPGSYKILYGNSSRDCDLKALDFVVE